MAVPNFERGKALQRCVYQVEQTLEQYSYLKTGFAGFTLAKFCQKPLTESVAAPKSAYHCCIWAYSAHCV